MRKYIIGGLSLITALADVWIWAYLHGLKGAEWWGDFPLFLTGLTVLMVCMAILAHTFSELFKT